MMALLVFTVRGAQFSVRVPVRFRVQLLCSGFSVPVRPSGSAFVFVSGFGSRSGRMFRPSAFEIGARLGDRTTRTGRREPRTPNFELRTEPEHELRTEHR